MSSRKKIIIIILIISIIAGGALIMFLFFHRPALKKDTLRSCRVYTGGGMLGGYQETAISRNKDGSVTLTTRSKQEHSMREVTTVYKVDPEVLDHIRDLVVDYNLYGASKRPYGDEYVLDGDTTSIAFSFSTESFSISEMQLQRSTAKMKAGFNEFVQYMHSLEKGEGVTTVEPQSAMLYLKSGYTLHFVVEDVFDGRLDGILSEEWEVSPYRENGIVLHAGSAPDLTGAEPVESAPAGSIIYDPESGEIAVLYADYQSARPFYLLAGLEPYTQTAFPLIREMEGAYRLFLN